MCAQPEPWLRGPLAGIHPLTAPVLYAFQQAREDLARYAGELTPAQLWDRPFGLGSVGFHVCHIAGSTERLTTYLEGQPLTTVQLAAVEGEDQSAGRDAGQVLVEMDRAFAAAERVIRALDPGTLAESRTVGRRHLPTTVIGLLTHIAEHTQRHVGQAIITARVLRS